MLGALAATLARPDWWALALAAFLVRGGFLVILLPILSGPTAAGLVTTFSPLAESVVLGRPSLEGALLGSAALLALLAGLAAVGLAGAWLDLALVREATEDEDIDAGWRPVHRSSINALSIRLTAHLPTLFALAYGFLRTIDVAYDEFTAPSNNGVQIVDRVVARVPDVVLIVLVAWLLGETIGALAARRAAAGVPATRALLRSIRQVLGVRGIATLVVTTAVLGGMLLAFLLAAGRAWEHLRGYLLDGADGVQLWAALALLVATWVLGLAVLGAGLAWRATAWTAEMTPG
jgi:hypothetical protein